MRQWQHQQNSIYGFDAKHRAKEILATKESNKKVKELKTNLEETSLSTPYCLFAIIHALKLILKKLER